MKMLKKELEARIISACENVIAAEPELTEIDSKFGDADHGLTMHKIAAAIKNSVTESAGDIKEMLDDAAMAVMGLNGGSAVPLWNSWLDGMQEGAPEADEVDVAGVKAMFASAFEALDDMSGAKVGDKTMMDTVIPASEAIASYVGDSVSELFSIAAEAAKKGAENSKNFVSKFGRAKTFGTKTIGTPDAGATSMAKFFEGLAKE
ncbi:MAG: DAK2 domain-containing protein [Oscillospiraceae bacterium]|jgi:dihydroxyacetone kinase-like protein|nr:DAK2 domain-containing protein [Oscillospiraceae bacterium]MBR2808578.1 DAK2 domain-containing protein [Oscillospiraceae bacterium]